MVTHNLPEQPYKKFFGRQDSVEKIKNTLLEGATFIASIDGVGGIGKTALAYHFCKEFLLPSNEFNTVIWITAKESVFDPFSKESMIKSIDNKFQGIETLIDTTLALIGFEDILDQSLDEKKELFEDFIKSEPVFFVLDNLENVEDEDFFKYITHGFNKFALPNSKLKVLTTSRKRKRIIDFPIEIEGLAIEDALSMLKYLANEYNIKDILHATDHNNIILIEKVGRIPLGIEFIIGQMTKGKSRGEIYSELEGYPSLEGVTDEQERKKRLSDIILFSFQNMYESLNAKEKRVFQTIAALEKNKTKNDPDISLELLMSITNMSRYDLESSLDVLIENKLVSQSQSNSYTISQMAISFVKQYYENFEEIEDEVVGKKQNIISINNKQLDKVDILINSVRKLMEKNEYEEAESTLLNALDVSQDYRIFYELAKVQRILNKFSRAADNYRIARKLNPTNSKIWYDWINMEDNRKRYNIAMQIINEALTKTQNNISIVLQKISIFKYKNKFNELREEIEDKLKFYMEEDRKEDYIKLLRNWKNIEYKFFKDKKENKYFEVIEKLLSVETDNEIKLQLLREELNAAKKNNNDQKVKKIRQKLSIIEKSIIRSLSGRVKQLNKLFNARKYDEAKKEARKILNWIHDDEEDNVEYTQNALRILLQILASEKDYNRIIITFEDFKDIGYKDENCINIYEKAKKEKEKLECEELIKEISINIQNIEYDLRNIIVHALEYDEDALINLLKDKNKLEWREQWITTKKKALKNDELLIHYSDLSHLRSILSWTKSTISKKTNNPYQAKQYIKDIVAFLENYLAKERNETFHSRLQLYSKAELNKILVDTQRLVEKINELKSMI